MNETFQSHISVSQMSEQLKLSRVHFYSLLKRGIFPPPIKREGCRPYFDSELQRTCHEIREKQVGVDGQPILFYSKNEKLKKESPASKKKTSKDSFLYDALLKLGIAGINSKQVDEAIKRLYPAGIAQIGEEILIRELFIEFSSK